MNYFIKYRNFYSSLLLILSISGAAVGSQDLALSNESEDVELAKGFSCLKPSCKPHKPCKLSSCSSCNKPKPCFPCDKPKPCFSCDKPKPCSTCNSTSSCGCGLGSACFKNVKCVNTVPTTITSSGVYCLASNIPAACDITVPLITIAVSDVNMNLSGNTLAGGQRGILVNPNLNNIQIGNGEIINTDAEAIIVSGGCSSISLLNLQIIGCNQSKCSLGTACIAFNGLVNGRISSCLISNVLVNDGVGTGISLTNVDYSAITFANVTSMSSVNPALNTAGIFVSGNYNNLDSCKVAHIVNNLTGLNAYGFLILNSINTIINLCQADVISSIAPAVDAVGFYILGSENTLLDHCTSSASSAVASGALPITANNAASFISQASIATQMNFCSASSNSSPKAGISNGFVLNADTLDNLTSCISQANGADGFKVFATCTHCLVRQSAANGNVGFGFNLTAANAGDIFYSNFAARNGTPFGTQNFSAFIPNVRLLGDCFVPTPGCFAGQSDNVNGL